jgi:cyclopropane-fatty-acyl-phospholipid synthase
MSAPIAAPICFYPSPKFPAVSSLFSLTLPNPRSWLASFGTYLSALCCICIDPYQPTARSAIHSVLDQAITKGQLTIYDSEGIQCFGDRNNDANAVHLRVNNDSFWTRIFVSGDLGCRFSFSSYLSPFH